MKIDWRLVRLLRRYKSEFLLGLISGLIAGILVTFQASYLSQAASRLFIDGGAFPQVKKSLTLLVIIILLRGALTFIHELMTRRVASDIKRDLRVQLYTRLNALGPSFLKTGDKEGVRTGELVNIVLEGIENLEVYLSQYLPQIVFSILIPASILVFVWKDDFISGLILLLTAPLIPFFMILIGDRAEGLTRRQWSLLSRMNAHFLDVLQGLPTLRIFGRSHTQTEVIYQVGDTYRQTTMGVLKIAFLSSLVLEWTSTLSTAIIAVQIGLRLLYGRLVFEQAFLILLLTPEFYSPLRSLAAKFHAGMAAIASADRIFEILEVPVHKSARSLILEDVPGDRSNVRGRSPDLNHLKPMASTGHITFDNVSFSPSQRERGVENISFELPAGELLVITGESGAGKSTLIDLLLRFNEPFQGQIKINGMPLQDLPGELWLRSIAWVPQRPHLLNASILDNIRLGLPDAPMAQVIDAAIQAQAHESICRLPQGYKTVIGENGTRLSGGEAQRIALARAFLKDAPILLLDEATAHLDPVTADLIHRSILTRKGRQTIVMITHNPQMLHGADWILTLQAGRQISFRKISEKDNWHDTSRSTNDGTIPPHLASQGYKTISTRKNETDNPDRNITESPPTMAESEFGLSQLKYLIGLTAPFYPRLILTLLLGWATITSGIGLLATSAYLISMAALQPSIAVLQVPIVAVRAFGLMRGIFRYLERYVSHDTSFRILAQLRAHFFRSLEPLIPGQLIACSSGDLLSRLHNDISQLQDFFIRSLTPPMVWMLTLLTIGMMLGSFSPLLALIICGLHLFVGVGLPVARRVIEKGVRKKLPHLRSMLSNLLIDGIQGLPDLLAFTAISVQEREVHRVSASINQHEKLFSLTRSLDKTVNLLATSLAGWLVIYAAISFLSNNQIKEVYLAALLLATAASFEATASLGRSTDILEGSLAVASRLEDIENTPVQVKLPPAYLPLSSEPTLVVRDLSFSYPNPELNDRALEGKVESGERGHPPRNEVFLPFTLKDINFSLSPGKRLALVGPTGAGKSTIFNLLLRFWDFKQGTILLGGCDIRQMEPDSVRSRFSLVSQHAHLFNATIAENLRIAKPDAQLEELTHVTRMAQIHDFILSLPHGYETWVGEHGIRLSAGERQRIAIARALLKDAPILLMDEPVSHLDLELARSILRNIYTQNPQRAIMTITHRLLEMEAMDEILLLSSGEIIARGQHSDLILEPIYRIMWEWEEQRK